MPPHGAYSKPRRLIDTPGKLAPTSINTPALSKGIQTTDYHHAIQNPRSCCSCHDPCHQRRTYLLWNLPDWYEFYWDRSLTPTLTSFIRLQHRRRRLLRWGGIHLWHSHGWCRDSSCYCWMQRCFGIVSHIFTLPFDTVLTLVSS